MRAQPAVEDSYLSYLKEALAKASTKNIFDVIVNSPFSDKRRTVFIDLGIIVLLLVDAKHGTINRIALSDTEMAKGAVQISEKEFRKIKIPVGYEDNIIARAIEVKTYQSTEDWKELFAPDLSPQAARFNQAGAGIECSVVYPLINAGVEGALIFSFFQPLSGITKAHHEFMKDYASMVARSIAKQKIDALLPVIEA